MSQPTALRLAPDFRRIHRLTRTHGIRLLPFPASPSSWGRHVFGQQLPQLGVLGLEKFQPPGLGHLQAPMPRAPSLMPCFRLGAHSGPGSFRMPMICFSLNRLFRIACLLDCKQANCKQRTLRGSRSAIWSFARCEAKVCSPPFVSAISMSIWKGSLNVRIASWSRLSSRLRRTSGTRPSFPVRCCRPNLKPFP